MKYVIEVCDGIVEYRITENISSKLPSYGIMVTRNDEPYDRLNNVFFTKEEANERCRWLVENDVHPELFRDMMEDIML